VEAALLGTPMVTFYKVTTASWLMGRMLLRVPFYSMVNLIAGRAVVPELMQSQLTGERLAAEAQRLLGDDGARAQMRADLAEVAARLSTQAGPMARASAIIQDLMEGQLAHV
jgi:lipid-A-disaccharide synthase